MLLRESVDALLDVELIGPVVPVVLHLLSMWDGRELVGVVEDDTVGAALSLRLLSTCSMVGLAFKAWLFDRSIGCAGELYTREGSTLAEVCEYECCTLVSGLCTEGSAVAGREYGCWTAKLPIAGVSKPIMLALPGCCDVADAGVHWAC